MSSLNRLAWIFLVVWLLCLVPALGQEKPPEKPWIGKLGDGREITKQDLDKILKANNLWEDSHFKEGQRADLSNANLNRVNLGKVRVGFANLRKVSLYNANLSHVCLYYTDLSGANLAVADCVGTNFWDCDLSKANFNAANLSGAGILGSKMIDADFSGANLSKARLIGADLRGANLASVDLGGTNFWMSDLHGCNFEPKPGLSEITHWVSVKGLSSLTYRVSPHGLVELREIFKKAGHRDQERQVTYALNHTHRIHREKESLAGKLESLFQLVCFEWTCDWGMSPGRTLELILLGLFVFTFPYLLALKSRDPATGIWLMLPSDRVMNRKLKDRSFKLTTHRPFRPLPQDSTRFGESILRGLRILRISFYFSILSAFNIGWRELNVGNWITRIQRREYLLKGTGWVRMIAGIQALLSVYLLALWVLTYFGRPFE